MNALNNSLRDKTFVIDEVIVRVIMNKQQRFSIQPSSIHKEKDCVICSHFRQCNYEEKIQGNWMMENNSQYEKIFAYSHHDFKKHNQKIFELLKMSIKIPDRVFLSDGFEIPNIKQIHLYFRQVEFDVLPLVTEISKKQFYNSLLETEDGSVGILNNYIRSGVVFKSNSQYWISECYNQFEELIGASYALGKYPYLNLVCWYENEQWILIVFPRVVQKSTHYYKQGSDSVKIIPQACEISGLFVADNELIFDTLNKKIVKEIYSEISFNYSHLKEVMKNFKVE